MIEMREEYIHKFCTAAAAMTICIENPGFVAEMKDYFPADLVDDLVEVISDLNKVSERGIEKGSWSNYAN